MKISVFISFLVFQMAIVSEAFALSYEASAGGRTFERGLSATLKASSEYLIWGDKTSEEDISYGLVTISAGAATHGQIFGEISLQPVPILALNYKRSWTQRYSVAGNMSCFQIQCFGPIERDSFEAKGLVGGDLWALYGSYQVGNSKARDTGEPVFDELENLNFNSSSDKSFTRSLVVGYRPNKNDLWGYMYRKFNYDQSQLYNEMILLIMNSKTDFIEFPISVTVGAGTYQSSTSNRGMTLIFALSHAWGDDQLTLF